jgi:opacity protein-like surface antigen
LKRAVFLTLLAVLFSSFAAAGDDLYFVTYSHDMEEWRNLEVSPNFVFGVPKTSNRFLGNWTELEYGVKGWWTTEGYVEGQKTFHDSAILTGFRWENRFRPLAGEHWINPVIYVEYEDLSDADKTLKDVVGFDSRQDFLGSNAELRSTRKHEIETKLILGSNHKGWNVSENFIAEKNLTDGPWEFGYAAGVSRPLKLAATSRECRWCRENFQAGVEFYGGLGTRHDFTPRGTSQYAAPVLAWSVGNGVTVRVSPSFGLNGNSIPYLMRLGASYEIPRFDRQIRGWFR